MGPAHLAVGPGGPPVPSAEPRVPPGVGHGFAPDPTARRPMDPGPARLRAPRLRTSGPGTLRLRTPRSTRLRTSGPARLRTPRSARLRTSGPARLRTPRSARLRTPQPGSEPSGTDAAGRRSARRVGTWRMACWPDVTPRGDPGARPGTPAARPVGTTALGAARSRGGRHDRPRRRVGSARRYRLARLAPAGQPSWTGNRSTRTRGAVDTSSAVPGTRSRLAAQHDVRVVRGPDGAALRPVLGRGTMDRPGVNGGSPEHRPHRRLGPVPRPAAQQPQPGPEPAAQHDPGDLSPRFEVPSRAGGHSLARCPRPR